MSLTFPSMFSLEGRTAVITGGTRGIGAQMAIALAEAGADIVLVQRDDSNKATYTHIAETLHRKCWIVTADLSDQSSVESLSHKVLHDLSLDISILVLSAGIQRRHPVAKFPTSDWNEVLQVNLTTNFTLTRDFGAHMLTRHADQPQQSTPTTSAPHRGSIIHIASLQTFQGGLTIPAYAASKGGIAQLTKSFANEWARHGVNVNAIAPGYVSTDMNEALINDPVRAEQILTRIPAGRWGTGEDFKGVVVFLAGRGSRYVNGEVVVVDGGWMGR